MKKFLRFVAGVCILGVAALAFFLKFAEVRFSGTEIKVARVANQEVVLFSQCDFSNDCIHKIGVRPVNGPLIKKLWQSEQLSEVPELFVSRDGTLLAVSSARSDEAGKSTERLFRAWRDLRNGRQGTSTSAHSFSSSTQAMLAKRGGKIALKLTPHDYGDWTWESRDYKDFGAS
jgi:hypothetical protein